VILGQKTFNDDDDVTKSRFLQNAQNNGLVDIAFEE
jgi:hypothetical protein